MFDIRKLQEKALYEAVRAESDAETAGEVVSGRGGTAESDPDWVRGAMGRLERRFSPEAVRRIRGNCQCGYGMEEKLALVRELMAGAASMEEFAASEKARAAGLSWEDGALFLQFEVCPCPMLAEVARLESAAWCQCTTGYSKTLFERAFHCGVDVELLQSIKMGDPVCRMKITLHDPVWDPDRPA